MRLLLCLLFLMPIVGCVGEAERVEVEEPEMDEETQSFDLSSYQWTHRPLVVFGPVGDPRLIRQQTLINDRNAGLLDRDMIVIIVTGNAASLREPQEAETTQLSPIDAAALRERFDVHDGEFAILLVGKDGGQKHRESTPTPLSVFFEKIDRMPMRQREMR
jgi:hypothetical protein